MKSLVSHKGLAAALSARPCGSEGGGAACGPGAGTARAGSLPPLIELERLPNTSLYSEHHSRRPLHQPLNQWTQQARPAFLRLRAPGEQLRKLAERIGRAVRRRQLGDHLAIVGCRSERLRIERNHGNRLGLDRLCKISGTDLRPLGDTDLVETITGATVVGTRSTQEIKQILRVAQICKIESGDHQNVIG